VNSTASDNSASRVDFYLVDSAVREAVQTTACRIAEKAYKQGHRVFMLVNDESEARELDTLLWTFSQSSFVPHARYGTEDSEQRAKVPVWIGSALPDPQPDEVLVTMSERETPASLQFGRIADLVGDSTEDKAAGRLRFKYYRNQGIQPGTHPINVPRSKGRG
jgi:DNA polymerase-3 subunit chi